MKKATGFFAVEVGEVMKKIFEAIFILFLLTLLDGCAGSLQNAAYKGDIQTITKLINDGANINENSAAGPALHYACMTCQLEVVNLLLGRGANVNATGLDNNTAMHQAAYAGCNDVIKLLIDKGAIIDFVNSSGYSSLSLAAYRGNASVKYLIEKGADPDIAINGLIKNNNNAAAKIVEQAAKNVRESKTQIATNRTPVQYAKDKSVSVEAVPSKELSSIIKSDVDELPTIKVKHNKNAYAIVIGIENYRQKLPMADFAVSDARLVSEYLTRVMGYPIENVITITNEHATKSDFEKYFERWLSNNVEKDSTVFIYYSGHGAPSVEDRKGYIMPTDGNANTIQISGYPLDLLYKNLAGIPYRKMTIVTDACFSGALLLKKASPVGIIVQNPLVAMQNVFIMNSSSGTELSSWYPDKGHGLFTYYFLLGLTGKADLNGDGQVTFEELTAYINENVPYMARKLHERKQTPTFDVSDKDTPIVSYK